MSNLVRSIAATLAVAGALTFQAPAFAQSSPVLGSWNIEADTPMGKFKSTLTFASQGDAYTVAIKDVPMPAADGSAEAAPPPEGKVSDVVVNGSDFSFKRSLTTPQGEMDLAYKGKVSGDSLTAEANSDFGAIPITGTRAAK
jgi:hypothetical protein